ncbi:unnamed protein product, partial [Ectocarpus sp. 13 AM-2016]
MARTPCHNRASRNTDLFALLPLPRQTSGDTARVPLRGGETPFPIHHQRSSFQHDHEYSLHALNMTRHVFILLDCLGAAGPPRIKTCQAEIPRGPHLVSKGERHVVLVMFHAGLVDKLDISV